MMLYFSLSLSLSLSIYLSIYLYLSLYLREVHRGYQFTLRTMLRSPFQYNTNEAYEATFLLFIPYPVHECARA